MAPATVASVIERIARHWPLAPDSEITLEANPTSVEAAKFHDFRAAGVNRVSLGVQALDAAALKFLGRGHDVAQAIAAVELAGRIFPRYSFDLIYARPGQDGAAWRAELDRALSLARDHVSLYQLTIEPNTGFHGKVARGEFTPLDQDRCARLYRITQERCARAGLPAYEISNHARPGAECRHNLVYWRYGDYVGVGPGAHGRLTAIAPARTASGVASDAAGAHGRLTSRDAAGAQSRLTAVAGDHSGKGAFRQWNKPERWLEQVEAQGHGTEASEAIAPTTRAVEALMMGLRLTEGVYFENFRAATGLEFDSFVAPDKLRRLIAGGFLARDRFRIRATPKGLPLLNALLAEIVP
jgi:oxygen-independent coproporphyrinogen-3 oxidase